MRKTAFILVASILSAFIHAEKKADSRINEIKKIISITAQQEDQFRGIFSRYSKLNDSIIKKEQTPEIALIKKKDNNRRCQTEIISLLDDLQKDRYITIISSNNAAGHKIAELKKITTLSKTQEKQIRDLYDNDARFNDSICQFETNPVVVAQKKDEMSKKCHEGVMGLLTDAQKEQYIKTTKTPEVRAKAEAKIQILRETNQYTEDELNAKKTEIFNYLMLEKMVYTRDKYNLVKQKENIAKLKLIKPNSLKESETREKLNAQGKVQNGNINW